MGSQLDWEREYLRNLLKKCKCDGRVVITKPKNMSKTNDEKEKNHEFNITSKFRSKESNKLIEDCSKELANHSHGFRSNGHYYDSDHRY